MIKLKKIDTGILLKILIIMIIYFQGFSLVSNFSSSIMFSFYDLHEKGMKLETMIMMLFKHRLILEIFITLVLVNTGVSIMYIIDQICLAVKKARNSD